MKSARVKKPIGPLSGGPKSSLVKNLKISYNYCIMKTQLQHHTYQKERECNTMSEDPMVHANKIAHKYSMSPKEYLQILDDLRALAVAVRLNTCLAINSHKINTDATIANSRRYLSSLRKK